MAIVGSNTGIVTMLGAGTTEIKASWSVEYSYENYPCSGGGYFTGSDGKTLVSESQEKPAKATDIHPSIAPCGTCIFSSFTTSPQAGLRVRPTVARIQYQSGSSYVDISGPLYVLKGTSVTFKAVPNPATATFPSGRPVWSGSSGASGTGQTTSVPFNTVSTTTSDFKTVTATSGNTVTVNAVVYDLTGLFTPDIYFAKRSKTRFGIEENVSLSFSSSPSGLTASQVGGLRWKLVTGSTTGILTTSANDGLGTYRAPDSAAAATLKLEIQGGPSMGTGKSTNFAIVEPSDGYINRISNVRHTYLYWGAGFMGQIVITPADVSFFNISFAEGGAPMHSSGWLSTFNDYHYPSAQSIRINSRNEVNTSDRIDSGDKAGPAVGGTNFANGIWYWDIDWYFYTNINARIVKFVTKRQQATSDASGTAVISKGGKSESKAADAPTSTY